MLLIQLYAKYNDNKGIQLNLIQYKAFILFYLYIFQTSSRGQMANTPQIWFDSSIHFHFSILFYFQMFLFKSF